MKIFQYKISKTVAIHILLLIGFLVFLINWAFPVIRFNNPIINYIIDIPFLLIPIILMINGFFFKDYKMRVLNGLILLFPSLLMLIFILFSLLDICNIQKDNIDPSFKCIQTVPLTNSQIKIYRTDGGATTSWGIVVRQEIEIFFGLNVVKNVYTEYPKYDIKVRPVGHNKIELDNELYELKEYVYF